MPFRLLAVFLLLVACGDAPNDVEDIVDTSDVMIEDGAEEETEDNPFASPDVEECDAEVFRQAIGVDISTTAFTPSENVRIFSEADLVTQEYLPKRTNIVTDMRGVITRVYCG